MTKLTTKDVQQAINYMADSGLINSGALVELDPETLDIEVVTSYDEYVAEAPRLYGDFSDRKAKDAWLSWTAGVLGIDHHPPMMNRAEWRRNLVRLIRDKANQITSDREEA